MTVFGACCSMASSTGALEAREIDHRVSGGQRVDHLGRELEVVRLGAVRGQGGNGDVLAADLLSQVLQGGRTRP